MPPGQLSGMLGPVRPPGHPRTLGTRGLWTPGAGQGQTKRGSGQPREPAQAPARGEKASVLPVTVRAQSPRQNPPSPARLPRTEQEEDAEAQQEAGSEQRSQPGGQ